MLCIWQINKEERSIRNIEMFKLGRSLDFFKIMEPPMPRVVPDLEIAEVAEALEQDEVLENESQKPSQVDRIWFGFKSGDQEAFQYDGETEVLSLVESEK